MVQDDKIFPTVPVRTYRSFPGYNTLEKLEAFFLKYKTQKYKKRDVVVAGDGHNSRVFFIKEGYMRVYRISEQGEELTLTILKPLDFFPLTWEANSSLDNCYLEAITSLEIWSVSKEEFFRYVKSDPAIFAEFTSYISMRLSSLLTRMEYLVFGTAYTKVASTVLLCAKRFGEQQGDHIVVDLPLTHKDISTLVGITRETTCLEMKKLERKGLISHDGRILIIKNIKRLEEESLLKSESELLMHNSL